MNKEKTSYINILKETTKPDNNFKTFESEGIIKIEVDCIRDIKEEEILKTINKYFTAKFKRDKKIKYKNSNYNK